MSKEDAIEVEASSGRERSKSPLPKSRALRGISGLRNLRGA